MPDRRDLRITVLDEDHVLRLLRDLIVWENASSERRAADFFLPEIVPAAQLAAVGAHIRDLCRPIVTESGSHIASAEIVICRRGELTAETVRAAEQLKFVQRLGSRRKRLDIEELQRRGVSVSLLPRRSLDHVADHVLLLALALARRFPPMLAAMRTFPGSQGALGQVSYNWTGMGGVRSLDGLTLGIVGMGEIGERVARRAVGFGMRVVHAARAEGPESDSAVSRKLLLDELLAQSDIVSIHVTPSGTDNPAFGRREIGLMKPGSLLINTSRGACIDEAALLDALRGGHLGGAGLDVYEAEPVASDNPLLGIENLVLTPHIAGGSRVDVLAELTCICENIAAVIEGLPPPHARVF